MTKRRQLKQYRPPVHRVNERGMVYFLRHIKAPSSWHGYRGSGYLPDHIPTGCYYKEWTFANGIDSEELVIAPDCSKKNSNEYGRDLFDEWNNVLRYGGFAFVTHYDVSLYEIVDKDMDTGYPCFSIESNVSKYDEMECLKCIKPTWKGDSSASGLETWI